MFWKKKNKTTESASSFVKSPTGNLRGEHALSENPSFLWESISDPIVMGNSLLWFDELESLNFEADGEKQLLKIHEDFLHFATRTLDVILREEGDPTVREKVSQRRASASDYNPFVFPEMEISPRDLNSVSVRESGLGKKLLAFLDKEGISYHDIPSSDDSEDSAGVYLRWHDTHSGFLNLQYLKVFKDQVGNESAYWYTHLLASNRPVDCRYIPESKGGNPFADLRDGASSPEGQYNLKWVMPSLLKTVAFLCESPSPMEMAGASREQTFGGVLAAARPRPAFAIARDETFDFTHDPDEWNFTSIKPPHTILFGWVLTEESVMDFGKIWPVISNGCTVALNIFEAGEQELEGVFEGMDWDMQVRSPSAIASRMPDVYGQRYPAEWMTIPEYSRNHAFAASSFYEAYDLPSSKERREAFEDLLMHGTDTYLLHSANSLVFGEYLDLVSTDESALEEALEILAMAYQLDPKDKFGRDQAMNALSNSGVLYYQAGKLEQAKRALLDALDGTSGEGESGVDCEASFVLALIYEELGDLDKADEYREMCEALGGYDSGSRLRRPKVSSAGSAGPHGARGFCTSCGQAFLKPDQTFCSACGERKQS